MYHFVFVCVYVFLKKKIVYKMFGQEKLSCNTYRTVSICVVTTSL